MSPAQKAFQEPQTHELISFVQETFGDELEFLWQDSDAAIWREPSTRKWFGIIQKPHRDKLGLPGGDPIEIINVKLDPLLISDLLDGQHFFPAYHMNKKTWLSIPLDGRLSTKEICTLISESRRGIALSCGKIDKRRTFRTPRNR